MDFELLKRQAIAFIYPYYIAAEDFVLDMTYDLAHDYMFLTPHYPFFFFFHTFWICYVIRRHAPQMKQHESLITAASITLLSRALTAYFAERPPALFDNIYYFPGFLLIWFVMNYFPFDLIYKIVSFAPVAFVSQFVFALVQVRESCHGIDIGLRAFPASPVGAILLSLILSSTESLVWLLKNPKTREFSTRVIIKNLITAITYFTLVHYHELFDDFIQTGREYVKIYAFGVYSAITLLNMIIYGLRGRGGIF